MFIISALGNYTNKLAPNQTKPGSIGQTVMAATTTAVVMYIVYLVNPVIKLLGQWYYPILRHTA